MFRPSPRFTGGYSEETLLTGNLNDLRQRSRRFAYADKHMNRYVQTTTTLILGNVGFKLKPNSLNSDGKPDTYANKYIDEAFDKWAEEAIIDGSTWFEFQERVVQSFLIDGEVFVRFVYIEGELKLQIIPPELVPLHSFKSDGAVKDGIKFNDWGKPLGYYVGSKIRDNQVSSQYTYIPADEILHLKNQTFISQYRGRPKIASVIDALDDLNKYNKSAVKNARLTAKLAGFIQSKDGEVAWSGQAMDANGGAVSEIEDNTIKSLETGQEFVPFDPKYPEGQLRDFNKTQLQAIASGLDTAYNILSNDLESVNFSSMRQSIIELRDSTERLQTKFKKSLFEKIYKQWLRHYLLVGIPTPKGNLKASNLSKYERAIFTSRGWTWIDPVKDVKSKMMEIEAGLNSRDGIILESGKDPAEVRESIVACQTADLEAGININQNESEKNENS